MSTTTAKTDTDGCTTVVAFLLVLFLWPAAILWENHLLYGRALTYGQWFVICIPLMICHNMTFFKIVLWPLKLTFGLCILLQVLSWIGLFHAPLIPA